MSYPLIDVMQMASEPSPQPNQRILCRHPFEEQKRAYITPSKVQELLQLAWDGENGGRVGNTFNIHETREFCLAQLAGLRQDHLRPLNPTPYKVAVSAPLFDFMHKLWLDEAPISDLLS